MNKWEWRKLFPSSQTLMPAAFVLFGILTLDLRNPLRWINVFFFLPLAFYLLRWHTLRICAVVLAFVLLIPSLLALLPRPEYVTHVKNLDFVGYIDPGIFPGIGGLGRFSTDEHGFRVVPRVDYSQQAPLRIFAIGGSTTECLFLDDKKTWPYLLQESLERALGQQVQVINTGVSGLRAVNHLATLRAIRPLHPNLIVFMLGFNDFNHDIKEHFSTPLRKLVGFGDRVAPSFNWLMLSIIARLKWAQATSQPFHERGEIFRYKQGSLFRRPKYEWKPDALPASYLKTLREISDTCDEMNVPCMFVSQTSAYQVGVPLSLQRRFWLTPLDENFTLSLSSLIEIAQLYNRELARFAHEHHHFYCDIASKISAGPEHFYDDCHFNEGGAALASQLIEECVLTNLKKIRD